MPEPLMVIIEGGSNTLPLSLRLQNDYHFTLVRYDVADGSFTKFIDNILFSFQSPRLCITPGHLTAMARGQITRAWFKEFEAAVALAGCRLILTKDAPGYLIGPYADSWLEKMAVNDARGAVDVVDWLGLRQGVPNGKV